MDQNFGFTACKKVELEATILMTFNNSFLVGRTEIIMHSRLNKAITRVITFP